MADTSNEWLMHYQILRLVNQCRRLIASEFGKKLHLNDDHLREQLAGYVGHSRSIGLQRVYAELRLALIDLEGPDELITPEEPAPTQARRMYRGQPVYVDEKPVSSDKADKARAKQIVYRGCVA